MNDLYDHVRAVIMDYRMIEPDELVIAGVSGGPDSISLLHMLVRLQKEMPFRLHAAHLDHSFRGREAEEEAEWIKSMAEKWGISCTTTKKDVPAICREKKLSAQDAAHRVRMAFFLQLKHKLGAKKIALGHHADDQAETMLMHFLTGAGLEGISGLKPVQGCFIRPLIFERRHEIEEYCRQWALDPRRDLSNEKNIYLRNKIRNLLIPWLNENINPQLTATLSRTAHILQAEENYVRSISAQKARDYLHKDAGAIKLLLSGFSDEHLAMQRRIIRQAYQMVGEKQGLLFKHVEDIRDLCLNKQVGKVLHLPGGVSAEKEYNCVRLYRGRPQKQRKTVINHSLNIPGRTFIPETGDAVECEYTDKLPDSISGDTAYLPKEEYTAPLFIRTRQPGDKFSPRGFKHSKKLKEYFIDRKIPQKIRDKILLLADASQVFWIIGIEKSNKLDKKSSSGNYIMFRFIGNCQGTDNSTGFSSN